MTPLMSLCCCLVSFGFFLYFFMSNFQACEVNFVVEDSS